MYDLTTVQTTIEAVVGVVSEQSTMELSIEMLRSLKQNDENGVVLVSPAGNLHHTFQDTEGNVQVLKMRYAKREEDFCVLSYKWSKQLNMMSQALKESCAEMGLSALEPINFLGLDIGKDYWVDFIQHFGDKELTALNLRTMGALYRDKEVYCLYLDECPRNAIIGASRGWMWQEVSFTRKIINLSFEWQAILLFCIKFGPSQALQMVKEEYLLTYGIDDEHIIDERGVQMKSVISAVAAGQRGETKFAEPSVSCLLQPPTSKMLEKYYALNQTPKLFQGAFNVFTSKNFTYTSDRREAATGVLKLYEKNIDADTLRKAALKNIYCFGGSYNHEGAVEEGVAMLSWADNIVVQGSTIVEGPLKHLTIASKDSNSRHLMPRHSEDELRVLKVQHCSFTRVKNKLVLSKCVFSDGSELEPHKDVKTYGQAETLGNGKFSGNYENPIYGPECYPICNEELIPQGKKSSFKEWIDIGFPFQECIIAQRWCPCLDSDGTLLTCFCCPWCFLLSLMPSPTNCSKCVLRCIWPLLAIVFSPFIVVCCYGLCGVCILRCCRFEGDNMGVKSWHRGCMELNTCLLECFRPLVCFANWCFCSSGRRVAVERLCHITVLDGQFTDTVEDIPSQLMIPSCPRSSSCRPKADLLV
jgi:hypothetical protein